MDVESLYRIRWAPTPVGINSSFMWEWGIAKFYHRFQKTVIQNPLTLPFFPSMVLAFDSDHCLYSGDSHFWLQGSYATIKNPI